MEIESKVQGKKENCNSKGNGCKETEIRPFKKYVRSVGGDSKAHEGVRQLQRGGDSSKTHLRL